ncbi:unnamed protein product, partial [Brenthis ino]
MRVVEDRYDMDVYAFGARGSLPRRATPSLKRSRETGGARAPKLYDRTKHGPTGSYMFRHDTPRSASFVKTPRYTMYYFNTFNLVLIL